MLLKPILEAEEGSEEAIFTKVICKHRYKVENVNGLLKEVFRCIHKERILHYEPIKVSKIVKTVLVLHNFRMLNG